MKLRDYEIMLDHTNGHLSSFSMIIRYTIKFDMIYIKFLAQQMAAILPVWYTHWALEQSHQWGTHSLYAVFPRQ